MGPEVRLPKRLDRDGLEHYRLEVERMITRLSDEAEAWAESGTTKEGERPFSHVMYRREAFDREHDGQASASRYFEEIKDAGRLTPTARRAA
jgi:hypothetical protein